jgi:hypothetical protein
MAVLNALKSKIEANPAGFSITEQDIQLALQGGLTGFISIQSDSFLAATPIGIILGLGTGEESRSVEDVFVGRFSVIIKDKQYQNLSYNELRYAVSVLGEQSQEFREVVKNITNDSLGPAFDDFSFEIFDSLVSEETNILVSSGPSFSFNNLPVIILTDGNRVTLDAPNDTLMGGTAGEAKIAPQRFKEIMDAYQAENGSDPRIASGRVSSDSDLSLNGNVSGITNEFQLAEVEAGGAGIIDAIIDFFVDYSSPASVLNTTYKNFIVEALRNPSAFQSEFNKQRELAALTISKNILYDFEYERRVGLYKAVGDATADTPIEDILNSAESAALADLAASGLTGEGGISNKTPIDVEKVEKFFEQCILLASMEELKQTFETSIRDEGQIDPSAEESNSNSIHQPVPYQERFYMVQVPTGQNDRLLNFLNAPRGDLANDFLNITPDIQAFLTPKIRLYKVFNEGNSLKQVEFVFRNSTDSTNILKNLFKDNDKFFRGSGFGIKDFSFAFNGTTPATAKNDITADLTLFFQDFSDFVTPVETTQGTFRFVDLIFYDKKNPNNPAYGYGSTHPDQYSPAYYRIRADVGWRVPEDNPQFDDACRKRNLDPDNIRDVIEKTNKSYYLNMVEHELDFKADGTVEIKAQYRGYIESVLKGTQMDALVDQEIINDRKERQRTLEIALRTCTAGEVARVKRIYAASEQKIIEDLYQRTYKRLLELNKIRSFRVLDEKGFREEGYFSGRPSIEDTGEFRGEYNDEYQYYFLGDLLYVMMDAMYSNNENAPPVGKTKIVLPTIEFEDFFEDSSTFAINLAQIPISHRYFTEWWSQHVIKAKKQSYPIMFYLRDIMNNLIADALIDTCLNRNYRKSFNFQTTSVMASGDPLANKTAINEPIITLDSADLPFVANEAADINDMTNYVIVYAAYSTTLPKGTGKYVEDLENGVYHFHLGQDRGIIYDVKFSKVDMAYIREARYKREGIEGLLQLGAVYRVNLTMFGNTLFYPGMLLYINPFGIGGEEFLPNKPNTIANKLGLGGYHLIEKVNSSITSGLFKTNVEAMFVYSGDGETRFNIQGKQKEDEEGNLEEAEKVSPTCASLVAAVRTDYATLQATGVFTTTATDDITYNDVSNLPNRIRDEAANTQSENLTQNQADQAVSGNPQNLGVNVGLSPEDLVGEAEEELNAFEALQQRLQSGGTY